MANKPDNIINEGILYTYHEFYFLTQILRSNDWLWKNQVVLRIFIKDWAPGKLAGYIKDDLPGWFEHPVENISYKEVWQFKEFFQPIKPSDPPSEN